VNLKDMAEWLEESLCGDCKRGYTCDSHGCEQARQIADLLKRMTPFKGRDSEGKEVTGWLIPE